MKDLYLFRHAKSSWDDPTLTDFERPLNKRGLKAAPIMGQALRKRKVSPDLIICSPARRAKETLEMVEKEIGWSVPVELRSEIYEAIPRRLFAVLRGVDDAVSCLLVIGHNPGLEEILTELTGERERFPTAALAHIRLAVEAWKDVEPSTGKLEFVLRPKEL